MKVDKFELKKVMLNMYETIIHDLKEELKAKDSLANIDEDNTLDPEDFSKIEHANSERIKNLSSCYELTIKAKNGNNK